MLEMWIRQSMDVKYERKTEEPRGTAFIDVARVVEFWFGYVGIGWYEGSIW